ncbi:PREDICTED: uncharacterized protein LOC107332376 [Acropora digitifera]|uniref:uncharacterized protein LOC107332376 n=1 Tax=Acropora digitifera TaxID=70779 RepID=UPI00077ABBD9|nr:PREDICTED: uncharacterized protein LOC107332376 [Acropora digitifera]
MSKAEYKSLLFRISKRLDEINALEHILFICEEKLERQADQDIHDTLSLLRKLEDSGFLGLDEMQEVKDILKAAEEWDLYEKVVKFESRRSEYKEFLERVIDVLEELNDLERLMSTVGRIRRIPEERKNDIQDVRSLVQVLEDMNCLGIDRFGVLKKIFTELNNDELLTELAQFQERRIEDETREMRKAQKAAVWSSARATSQRIIGDIRVRCTFRTLSGVVLTVGTGLILRRCSTFEDFVEAFTVAILPAANELRAISEGSVCFTVRAETSLALEELHKRYSTGRLQRDLQEFLVTDDIRQLANGEEVVVSVYVDDKEFREALDDLTNSNQEGRDDIEKKQSRFLDDERLAFVQNYLENTDDARSLTTGTSDDGIGSRSAPSDLALEEPGEVNMEPCLKDLSKKAIAEFIRRLRCDKVLLDQFYHSFGLENRYFQTMFVEIGDIRKLFPDTPIKLLIDFCRALQLYDLVEFLEKAAKPRTLRPALPLKEIAKLPSDSKRPTSFYSKVKIVFVGDGEETFDTMGNIFKKICPGSKISSSNPDVSQFQRSFVLDEERKNIVREIRGIEHYEDSESSCYDDYLPPKTKKTELEKRKDEIEKELSQMSGDLQAKKKKIEADIFSAFDKSWCEGKDDKSTLLIAFQVPNLKDDTATSSDIFRSPYDHRISRYGDTYFRDPITDIMMEKLTSFPTAPKLVVTPTWNIRSSEELREIPECLDVEYMGDEGTLSTILEVLSKRWQILDPISIVKEAQRTPQKNGWNYIRTITDNLSAIPRFQPTPEKP